MADLTGPQAKALGLYGPEIQAAATQHLTTADLWGSIRSAAAAAGLESPGVAVQAVSALRGMFGQMTRAAEQFDAAGPEAPITARMIGQAPWSPALAVQAATPNYLATFELTRIVDGEEITEHKSVRLPGQLPATVGDLSDLLEQEAEAMTAEYGGDFGGIGGIALQAIAPR